MIPIILNNYVEPPCSSTAAQLKNSTTRDPSTVDANMEDCDASDSDLDDPRCEDKYKPFKPPAWLIDLAQHNLARSEVTADVLRAKVEEVRDAARATVPSDALKVRLQNVIDEAQSRRKTAKKDVVQESAEVRTQKSFEPLSLTAQPQPTEEMDRHVLPDAEIPRVTQSNDSLGQEQEWLREKRQGKKKLIRAQQAKEGVVANQVEVNGQEILAVAESSRAGAAREILTNATTPVSLPNTMDGLYFPEDSTDRYPIRPLPKWYTSINENSFDMKQLSKKKPQDLTALDSLKAYIAKCREEQKPFYEELRNEVHKAEIKLSVNKYILKKARILNPDTGLPAIFRKDSAFPSDLKADSYQLYNRWYNQDFDQDILRGIITKAGKDRNNDSFDPEYRSAHPTTAKYYGEGNLVQGQWWPTQLCTVRDGAHGAAQGGIFGEKDRGAYSIVLSSGTGYHDLDNGDTIEYSGTESKDATPTENTHHLIQSKELQNPIRVIRSHQLPKSNQYRPSVGLRYDGLYKVKEYMVVDKDRAMYRFQLERCEGQDPIRCEDDAARRPTVFEEMEWEKLKKRK